MDHRIGRRRFIAISAASAALGAIPMAAGAVSPPIPLTTWRGTALGADASIRLYHPDGAVAARVIERCVAEIERLEQAFSLYRPDSALSRLNRDGFIDEPPLDMVRLLGQARRFSQLTTGAFDVTVQPLWRVYAAHFDRPDASPDGPDPAALAEARKLVGYGGIDISPDRIALARRGMALTLNGIAQGYITDRVGDLLRREGMEHVLLDLGETLAIGTRPNGQSWKVGIKNPDNPDALRRVLGVADGAVATSGAYGFQFDEAGRFHHLFNPRTGLSESFHRSVSVLAADATTADTLSTAFSVMQVAEIERVVARLGLSAFLVGNDGGETVLGTITPV